jgi:hypothetical protein
MEDTNRVLVLSRVRQYSKASPVLKLKKLDVPV